MSLLHWELRKHVKELRSDGRLAFLITLLLHANIRLRCWPSMELLVEETGWHSESLTKAKRWALGVGAIMLVPYHLRVDEEAKLPAAQHVYQLTGVMRIGELTVQYLYMTPEALAAVAAAISNISAGEISPSDISVGESKGITTLKGGSISKESSSAGKPAQPSNPDQKPLPIKVPDGHQLANGAKVFHYVAIIDGVPALVTVCGKPIKPGDIKAGKKECGSCRAMLDEGPFITALARLCFGSAEGITDSTFANLRLTVQEIKSATPDVTPEMFAADGPVERWWIKHTSWWSKKRRPKPHELRVEWPTFVNSEEGGKGNVQSERQASASGQRDNKGVLGRSQRSSVPEGAIRKLGVS